MSEPKASDVVFFSLIRFGNDNLTLRISMSLTHIWHDEALPLSICHDFFHDPFSIDNWLFDLILFRFD